MTVLDSSGDPLQGAPVAVAFEGADLLSVLSDRDGRVRLQDLRSGDYAVTIGVPGFARAAVAGLEVGTGCITAIAIPLVVGTAGG